MPESLIFTINATSNDSGDTVELGIEIAKVGGEQRKPGVDSYVVRRLDAPAEIHVIDVDDESSVEQIIARGCMAIAGIKAAKPRAAKKEAAEVAE